VLQQLVEHSPSWSELANALGSRARSTGKSDALGILSLAFVYDLVDASQDGRRTTAGGPYATMLETGTDSFPPRPRDVDEEVRALWRSARDAVESPIVGARIGDLLYVSEGKSAHVDGRAGARDLVELAALSDWSPLDRARCISRAMEVMAELNDQDALQATVCNAIELVDELLDQEHPGPPFIVLRALIGLKPKQRPHDLDELFDRVIARFDSAPAAEQALSLAARASSNQQRQRELRRRQLQCRIEEAGNAEGLAKVTLLQRAIELARRFGFTADADGLLKEQQDLPHEQLGFQSVTTSVEVPKDAVLAQVDLIVGSQAADLFDALTRFGRFCPPGSSNSEIDEQVEQQAKDHPILGLFGQSTFGPASSVPNFIADSADTKRLVDRGRQCQINAAFYGRILIAPMLDEAMIRHGRPSREQLSEHFATELIGPERGERIARAVELFWDQQYDDAAHVIVPRLESVLRDIARAGGIAIAKPAQEGRFAGVVSLNVVMVKLRELYDDATWLCYLEALLCDPLAINLRNDVAHGLAGRVGGVQAALLVHAGCYLAQLDTRSA
jgi:hypothetical protein